MNWIYFELSIVKLKANQARAVILCGCVILAGCSQTTKTAENVGDNHGSAPSGPTTAASGSPTRSPIPEIEPLKIPESVASGAVTESRGTWSKAVQSIDYVSGGIRDGRNNGDPVPISQSLIAFNLMAAPQDRFTEDQITYFTREAQVPAALRSETTDPEYGGLRILLRRQSGNARITVFDGAHDKNTEAAFRWLNPQRRGR